MGAVADALEDRARALGVEIRCGVEVVAVDEDAGGVTVRAVESTGGDVEVRGDALLAAVAPAVLDGWLDRPSRRPVGAQMKINMLLDRLPRLASGVDPAVAFAGTTHLEEGFAALEEAFATSAAGSMPTVLPSEVYCHSLTDRSIMNGESGATLTLFGLHSPVALFDADPEGARTVGADAALAALQRHLAEPLEECLARDADGRPCLDIASPLDVQASVGMPGGNIFHGDLSWPWLDDDEPAEATAARYGVEVPGSRRILMAGAGSRRGGGVSGLGGAAAMDALLETVG
jgi:phytoene dehydrogenase-like protein